MSPTRVHDRHISLHLQGSLGERTSYEGAHGIYFPTQISRANLLP